jgi:ABC-2 type transport system permease protein
LLSRSAAIARNELRVLRRDPTPLVVLVVMPLLMAPLFATTFKGALLLGGHPDASGADFAIPAQTAEFAFFLAPYTGFAFFRDHGWKTWPRLRASRATALEIVVGKTLPMLALGIVQILVLLAFGVTVLHLHLRGEAPEIVLVSGVYVAVAVAFGVALTAVLRTSQQLNAFGFLGATLLGALGGALVPLSTLPAWTRRLAPATPQYWTMRASHDLVLDGRGGGSVVLPVLVLSGFVVALVAVALARLRVDDAKVGPT